MRGIFEFEASGVKRGFKFGTYALAVACEESNNISTTELFTKLGVYKKGKGADLKTLLNLFYGAAVHYAESKRLDVDFTKVDVSDWLDELGTDKCMKMFSDGLSSYQSKNSPSPEQPGNQTAGMVNGLLTTT